MPEAKKNELPKLEESRAEALPEFVPQSYLCRSLNLISTSSILVGYSVLSVGCLCCHLAY